MASISITGKPSKFSVKSSMLLQEAGVLDGAEVFKASPQGDGVENRQAELNIGSKAVQIWNS